MVRKIREFKTLDDKRVDSKDKSYKYVTKHGVGPGTLPKDVKLIDWEDMDNYLTVIYLDRPLSTEELKYYDIYPETENHRFFRESMGDDFSFYGSDDGSEWTSAIKSSSDRWFIIQARDTLKKRLKEAEQFKKNAEDVSFGYYKGKVDAYKEALKLLDF